MAVSLSWEAGGGASKDAAQMGRKPWQGSSPDGRAVENLVKCLGVSSAQVVLEDESQLPFCLPVNPVVNLDLEISRKHRLLANL